MGRCGGLVELDEQARAQVLELLGQGFSVGEVATIRALDRAIRVGSANTGRSVYDERGLLAL